MTKEGQALVLNTTRTFAGNPALQKESCGDKAM